MSIDFSDVLRKPGGHSEEYDGQAGRDDFAGVGECRVP